MEYISDLKSISEMENKLFQEAENKYGDFFNNARDFINLSHECIKNIDPDGWIFCMFFGQFNKHVTLAILSAIRLHHIQANLNMRIALESGANAAYAIYSRNKDDFLKIGGDNIIEAVAPEKRYKWLSDNFKEGNDAIKRQKDLINQTSAHSNIIYAFSNWEIEGAAFKYLFFDREKGDKIVKSDLWFIANSTMGLLDLFCGVNKKYRVMDFKDDFIPRLKEYENKNKELKEEFLKMPKLRFL